MAFDPYHIWLGIPRNRRPPTYYDLLGIEPGENDKDAILSALSQRRSFIQSKLGEGYDKQARTILKQFDEAASTLLVPEFKSGYDRQLGLHLRGRRRACRRSFVLPTWMESNIVRVYGEGSGIVGDVLGILSIIVVAIGLMLGLSYFVYQPASDIDPVTELTWMEKASVANKKDDLLSPDSKSPAAGTVTDASAAKPHTEETSSSSEDTSANGRTAEPPSTDSPVAAIAPGELAQLASSDKSVVSTDLKRRDQSSAEPSLNSPSSTQPESKERPRKKERKQSAERRVNAAMEGEKLKVLQITNGNAAPQGMGNFQADRWSGGSQLFWTGGKPKDKLTVELPVEQAGRFELLIVFTKARDYGTVQVWLDAKKIGAPLDLYNNGDVITTGIVKFGVQELSAGKHQLTFEITGAHVAAIKKFMVGIDAVQLGLEKGQLPKSSDGLPLNLNFEKGTLDDWVATGNAFKGQPLEGDLIAKRRSDMQSQHTGKYWVGTFELEGADPRGMLVSAPFTLELPYASFLVGGGRSIGTRVDLVHKANGKVLAMYSGYNSESMRLVVADLSAHVGKEIFIRIIDNANGGWGHINFDDFQLHAEPPAPISQNLIFFFQQ